MLLLLTLIACKDNAVGLDSDSAAPSVCPAATPGAPVEHPQDDTLRLNHAQALGTHNSFHVQPDALLDDSWAYTHVPLAEQLATQGVRQLELDFHLRDGGAFEVFHLPNIDAVSTCGALVDCLCEVWGWSVANPSHLPVMIWMEPKDDVDGLTDEYVEIAGHYEQLDEEVRAALGERLFTPDELRGSHDTLPEAVAAEGGWPTLGALRGRVIVSMLDGGAHREAYLEGAPALEGRALFVHADSVDDAFAATFKIDDPVGGAAQIGAALQAGFLVTSNVDGASGSDEENQARLEAALAVGSNFLSSDFPAPVDGRDYVAVIPGGTPARCNPVTAPEGCTSEAIEGL